MSHPQHCPGCGNRCSLDAPSCTTGERYARFAPRRPTTIRPRPPRQSPRPKNRLPRRRLIVIHTPPPKERREKTAPDGDWNAPRSRWKIGWRFSSRVLERTMERNQPNQKSGQSRLLTPAGRPAGEGQLTQRALMEHMGIRSSSSASWCTSWSARPCSARRVSPRIDAPPWSPSPNRAGQSRRPVRRRDDPFRVLSTAEQETLLTLLTKLNKDEG